PVVLVECPIYQIQIGVRLVSIDGNARVIDAHAPVVRGDSWHKVDELPEVSLIQRQRFHLVVSDEIGDFRALGLQRCCFARNGNYVGHTAQHQRDWKVQFVVYVEMYARGFRLLETRLAYRQLIVANGKVAEEEYSGRRSCGGPFHTGR